MTPSFRQDLIALLPRLRRFALTLTGQWSEADDLVQVACEKALASASQWQDGTRLDSWMYRIMQNHWIDQTRAHKRHGIEADPELLEQIPDELWARRIEAQITLERVVAVMQELPEAMRVVLALVSVEGLSYQDAAQVLEVPTGTVMSRLSRARAELMRRLAATEEPLHA